MGITIGKNDIRLAADIRYPKSRTVRGLHDSGSTVHFFVAFFYCFVIVHHALHQGHGTDGSDERVHKRARRRRRVAGDPPRNRADSWKPRIDLISARRAND